MKYYYLGLVHDTRRCSLCNMVIHNYVSLVDEKDDYYHLGINCFKSLKKKHDVYNGHNRDYEIELKRYERARRISSNYYSGSEIIPVDNYTVKTYNKNSGTYNFSPIVDVQTYFPEIL